MRIPAQKSKKKVKTLFREENTSKTFSSKKKIHFKHS